MKAVLHTDGGARGNPGPAGIGVVLEDPDGNLIARIAQSIGVETNNVAEYKALIAGLNAALEHGVGELDIYCDSELVVSQVNGEWKIKNERLRSLAAQAEGLMSRFERTSLKHVPRSANSEADRLANEAMDAAAEGEEFSSELEQRSFFDES